MKKSIDELNEVLIKEEAAYFNRINQMMNVSAEQKLVYSKETISERYQRINDLIFNRFNGVIQNGPFAGMLVQKNSTWKYSHVGQMILGVYESLVLEALFSDRFRNRKYFVDIGAADGYYPIGLTKCGRISQAFAFEISPESRKSIIDNATTNGVIEKIDVQGLADYKIIKLLSKKIDFKKTIFLIDIEGAEFDLLSREMLSLIRDSVVIIEVHNWIEGFLEKYSDFLSDASEYFSLDVMRYKSVDMKKLEAISDFPDDNRFILLSEGRPCLMRYLLLTPKPI